MPKETLIVKMSKGMKGSLPYLQILAKSKPKLRKILIQNVPESVITAIYECCLNTLKGVIPLTTPLSSNRSFYVFEKLSCSPMHGDVSCTVLNDASGALLME